MQNTVKLFDKLYVMRTQLVRADKFSPPIFYMEDAIRIMNKIVLSPYPCYTAGQPYIPDVKFVGQFPRTGIYEFELHMSYLDVLVQRIKEVEAVAALIELSVVH